jgi:uncharacterized membrane protein
MQLQSAIEIRAPADRVFDVVSCAERLPAWNTSVSQARLLTPPPVGLGARALMTGRVLGQLLTSETEVVRFEPPRLFETVAVRGPRLTTSFHLETIPVGTRLEVRVSGEPPGGKVGGLVAERVLRVQLAASLERLRALCEHEWSMAPSAGGV